MKEIILVAQLFLAQDGVTNFYGPDGSYQGRARTRDGTTNFYGPDGSYQGRARRTTPDPIEPLFRQKNEEPFPLQRRYGR